MIDIPSSCLIACIYEGGAEKAIMKILLDNDFLIFNREQLLEGEVLPRISVKDFENKYLKVAYDEKIVILRVIDSRREQFNLGKPYQCQVREIINVITAPEIEMLVVIGEGKYDDFCKSNAKPSEYCKINLKMKNVKNQKFMEDYFSDPRSLIQAIQEYHRVHQQKPHEASLFDLLKDEYKQ